MNRSEAKNLLAEIFEECGVEPNTVPIEALESYAVYRSERFHLQRGILAAMLAVFFLLPFLFIPAKFTVRAEGTGERRLPVYSVEVRRAMPVMSVTSLLRSRSLPIYEAGAFRYTIEPVRNGTMTVNVTLINRQTMSLAVDVSDVDDRSPALISSEITDEEVTLQVADEGVGVDMREAYAVSSSGELILPIRTDSTSGEIVFAYPTETWDVYIPDHIGNTLHLAMRLD